MAEYQVFIDGSVGTTGLRIVERLASRQDIALIQLPEAQRKNIKARAAAVEQADISVLCLPDAAARELVAAVGPDARICDTSTAHRTNPGWVYGFPEIGGRRNAIQTANRVAVPGCHASGFLALVAPLVEKEVLAASTPLSCHSITGYSGGGKSMIADYTQTERPLEYDAPRLYGLELQHKHLPEMQAVAGLASPPLFCPIVCDYYSGMLVTVPLQASQLPQGLRTPTELAGFFKSYYTNEATITVAALPELPQGSVLAANTLAGRDSMQIYVVGNEQLGQIVLAARFDNLGKGASGAAVQCMNLMLGCDETTGLIL